jgi:hypothetical protein
MRWQASENRWGSGVLFRQSPCIGEYRGSTSVRSQRSTSRQPIHRRGGGKNWAALCSFLDRIAKVMAAQRSEKNVNAAAGQICCQARASRHALSVALHKKPMSAFVLPAKPPAGVSSPS